jgi:hypothetical protein
MWQQYQRWHSSIRFIIVILVAFQQDVKSDQAMQSTDLITMNSHSLPLLYELVTLFVR